MKYPNQVELCEVGPRDGFQFESKIIPTERKVEWIRQLADAGLPRIQITSFVHPIKVPQMADAEQVIQQLLNYSHQAHGPVFSGLALNLKGVERAAAAGLQAVDLSIATNKQHGMDNAGMSVEEGIVQAEQMIAWATARGLGVQLNLQTVWGYKNSGDTPLERVVALAKRFSDAGLESFSLADSTGMANPTSIKTVVEAVQSVSAVPLVLHLHDTRGLGIANIVAALEVGVSRFDTSLGGLGGCPFIPGATGNVATEDVVYLLESLGIRVGSAKQTTSSVQNNKIASVTREVAAFLERPLPGNMYALL